MATPDLILDTDSLIDISLSAFDKLVGSHTGFRERSGQKEMAKCIAESIASSYFDSEDNFRKAIAVIQAGTGIGKSAAYCSTAIAQGLARNIRVVIATATVALQEQLMNKDLPLLAQNMTTPFKYALAKGRGRYLCLMKAEKMAHQMGEDDSDLFEQTSLLKKSDAQDRAENRQKLAQKMITMYERGEWDGERDSWRENPEGSDWGAVAADYHSCTSRHCPFFKDCSYFKARQVLVDADVIVANHDLVLATLGTKTLPDMDRCIVIFDEAHNLPSVALDQFSSSMDLQNLRWLDKLPRALGSVSAFTCKSIPEAIVNQAAELKLALQDVARLATDILLNAPSRSAYSSPSTNSANTNKSNLTFRFQNGMIPEELMPIISNINQLACQINTVMGEQVSELKTISKDDPTRSAACAQEVTQLGGYHPKLASICETSLLLMEEGEQPLAKWLSLEGSGAFLQIHAHACPIVPSDLLNQHLWSNVRSAILTSASLTTCGTFNFFLREAGLNGKDHVQTLEVKSPFDYAKQGKLEVKTTKSEPKDAANFNLEVAQMLCDDLLKVKRGALVLFTSKAQMQIALEALPSSLKSCVFAQGQQSRQQILATHKERIEQGQKSIIFGLQSFGEGIDLPGELCESLFITKLPFSSPSDPVDEARSEWLRTMGRDPFMELVIPATGMRLLQWTGRAIRTEDDKAHIICYDKRLTQRNFGRLLLAGLPNYAQ